VKKHAASTNCRPEIPLSKSLPLHGALTHSPKADDSLAQTQSPVVKRETLGHSHTLRGDWPLFQQTVDSLNIDEAAYLYSSSSSHSAPPQQPIIPVMMQAPDQRQYHQAVQADTTTAPLTAMRNSRSTRSESSLSPCPPSAPKSSLVSPCSVVERVRLLHPQNRPCWPGPVNM
jgi:hypothetical protein